MTRHLLFAFLIVTTSALAQTGRGSAPPKTTPATTRPKVLATPPPAKPGTPVVAAGTPGAPAAPAAPRKRPVARKPANPAAAYLPKVKAAFALRWAETVQPRMAEFTQGKVSVAFKLDAEGKVAEFAVTENTSNEAFATFCEQFVRETEFEKPPVKALADGLLEIPFTFWIY